MKGERHNYKYNAGTKYRKERVLNKKILMILAVICAIVCILCLRKKDTNKISLSPEMAKSKEYEKVEPNSDAVYDGQNKEIDSVKFDAYFIKDTTGDGVAESRLRCSCNEIGKHANIYMDLSVQNKGKVKEGKITINAKNFTFKTSLLKDEVIAKDYISDNTTVIELNELTVGMQKNIIGSIYSNVGYNNVSNLSSKENTITFSGKYVEDGSETEIPFSKEIKLTVDWYSDINCNIKKQTNVIVESLDTLADEDFITFNFNVTTYESKNTLPMEQAYIEGTMPELNGYKPTSVTITGANITYTYDEKTGKFTAHKDAVLDDENKVIKQNAYSYSSSNTRYTDFAFTVVYPRAAYEQLGEDVESIELSIPIEAKNEGYNNPDTKHFDNPYISETVKDEVNIVIREKEETPDNVYSPSFNLNIGDYVSTPYNTNVIKKNKPLNLYNDISEKETDDFYIVTWTAYTGTNGNFSKILMYETQNKENEYKCDEFEKTGSENISMYEMTSNYGIYFSGADSTLGPDGWIKVYDAESNTELKTFDKSNWNSFSRSNPYKFENSVKHIKIETSSTNGNSYLYVYSVKELNDDAITDKFTRDEFDELKYINTNLYGEATYAVEEGQEEKGKFTKELSKKALYIAPTSIANLSIADSYIPATETKEHETITIKTDTTSYNTEKWKNGEFLIKLPQEIILAEINNITTTNEKVKISAYDVYEEDGNFFIKIITENDEPEDFSIKIDCNLTPDPSTSRKSVDFELYATNGVGSDYCNKSGDTYDVDGDVNKEEQVNHRTTSLTIETGTGLSTTEKITAYDNQNSTTVVPRVGKADNKQKTAKIQLSVTNNYNTGVQGVQIVGVVPFVGNDFVMNENDMGSEYTTSINSGGTIQAITEGLEGKYTVYYSENEIPMDDIEHSSNTGWDKKEENWKTKEQVQDWKKIKSYLIVFNSEYEVTSKQKIEFEYTIDIPEDVDFNKTTYSSHAVNYAVETEEGLYYTSTASGKVGLMIAKQYELEIVKYQKDTDKKLSGITFTLTEDGQDTSTIKTTDKDGKIVFSGLYAERGYTLKEQKTTDDYVLNEEEINFYTYVTVGDDGQEKVHLVKSKDDESTNFTELYKTLKSSTVQQPDEGSKADYKIHFEIENEPKAKLVITKKEEKTGNYLKNAKFRITGEGKDEICYTDAEGKINISGLYLNEEYTLQELKLKDYYIPKGEIKFTITSEGGNFQLNKFGDNGTTKGYKVGTENIENPKITVEDSIPTLNIELQNEKIPSYKLKLTKYAKGEKDEEGNDKKLPRAQYQIFGDGISEQGKIYQTNENGELIIDDLYEYVKEKDLTCEYTLKEIYAPEGYSVNTTELKFKLCKENNKLKFDILSGEDVIRAIENSEETIIENKDIKMTTEGDSTTIEIGVEDSQIFSMFKYTRDGPESVKTPIKGTKFKITYEDGSEVTGTDGKPIGEWVQTGEEESEGYYAVTTDANGRFTANLPQGMYKAIEMSTDEKYELPEDESERTYVFGIGESVPASWDWKNSVAGAGWDYINSITKTENGGVIGVGSFSKYSKEIGNNEVEGIDVDQDGEIDENSQGFNDGLIVNYDND